MMLKKLVSRLTIQVLCTFFSGLKFLHVRSYCICPEIVYRSFNVSQNPVDLYPGKKSQIFPELAQSMSDLLSYSTIFCACSSNP